MENLPTPGKKLMMDTLSVSAYPANGALKLRCIFLAALLFPGAFVCAQAPTISYSGPQTYTPGTAITPLIPTSSGVTAVSYSTSPVIIGSGFTSVYGVATDAAGNVYMTDPGSGQIKKIPAGGGSPVIVPTGRTHINSLKDLALDTLGDLFFTDGNHKAYELTKGATGAPAFPVFIFESWGIAADNNGLVFVTDNEANRYELIELRTGLISNAPGGSNLPTGIAVDDADNLYIANYGSNLVRKLNIYAGAISTIGSGFNKPNGVALDYTRNVFVADQGNNAVKMVPAGNNTAVIIGSGFNAPTGVAADGAGNVYVADNGNNEIKKISPVGGYYIGPTFLPPGLSFDNTTGIISGTPTGSFPAKQYTITAYNSFGSTSASVIIRVKNSVDLASLTPSSGTLTPSFSPGTTTYTVIVDKSVKDLGVATTTVDATATVKKTSGALKIGLNIIPITVISRDGPGSKTYTLYVTRGALSSNAFLSQIQPDAGHLSPYFTPAITNYADTVPNNILSIHITPASSFPLATITVNGVSVLSDSLSQAIPLAQGLNTITTVVTAQDGVTTKTYTLTVFRALSNDADLTFMQPTAGFMAPVFTPVIISYDDTVNYTNLAMEITPIAHDSLATITVNGVAVVSGSMSQAIALNEWLNIITTVVTARDGVTTKTFTLTVMRAFSTDAYLTQIQPSAGMLSPVFNPMVTGYTDAVNNTNAAITVTPAVDDPLATLTVNGAAQASGSTSPAIPLSVGSNTITTIVTAPDGVTTKTYTLTVNRAAPIPGPLNAAYQPVGVAIASASPLLADDGLLVHQGISPNGDGINDFLVIENITNYPDNKLSIMNRNGQLIFETKGYDNSSKVFDGHSNKNGRMQLPGTYFYQLEYTVKGILKTKTGFIALRY